jgi:hypothetical protein
VIRLQSADVASFTTNLAGCGVLGGIGNLLVDLLAVIEGNATQALIGALPSPVCRARDSMIFEACPTP